jgi:hypothetical protein
MEIINRGTNDINQMAAVSCCWPPGTENVEMPIE